MLEKLKTARKEANLKQKEVAQRLKCTQSYVSKTENGHLRVDVVQLKEFADLYKKNIMYFLD